MPYILDPRHQNESIWVKDLNLCELRLFDHAELLWLILIPKRENVVELIDLSWQDQQALLQEINIVAQVIKKHFPCDKLNIATLGNVVPQLHVHVIARRRDDLYFPMAPFGCPRQSYGLPEKADLIAKLQSLLS